MHLGGPSKSLTLKQRGQNPLAMHLNAPSAASLGKVHVILESTSEPEKAVHTRPISRKLPPLEPRPSREQGSGQRASNSLFQTFDRVYDSFLELTAKASLTESIESTLCSFFSAKTCVFWSNLQHGYLYSKTRNISASYTSSLAGASLITNSSIRTSTPTSHQCFSASDSYFCPVDSPIFIFPVADFKESPFGVVQIIRNPGGQDFTEVDEAFASYFQRKFQGSSRWLLCPRPDDQTTIEILSARTPEKVFDVVKSMMAAMFHPKATEIWSLDKQTERIFRYTGSARSEVSFVNCGIVGQAVKSMTFLSSPKCSSVPSFSKEVDGLGEESIVVAPSLSPSSNIYAIVLRGAPPLTSIDESIIQKLSPYVSISMSNAESLSRKENSPTIELSDLANIDSDRLSDAILEMGRILTKADRCSIFFSIEKGQKLSSYMQRGLKDSIELPASNGICGKAFTTKATQNISDVSKDPSFDSSIDSKTGYKTRNILAVPIIGKGGEAIGVAEMLNKSGGEPFTSSDESLVKVISTICGVFLENSRLREEVIDVSTQLRSFFGVSLSVNSPEDSKRLMVDIVRNARIATGARRAVLYALKDGLLSSIVVDGGRPPQVRPTSAGLVGASITSRKGIINNEPVSDPLFSKEEGLSFEINSMCVCPIFSTSGDVIGAVEMVNKAMGPFIDKDLRLLQSFSSFLSAAIEGSVKQSEMILDDTERGTTIIPAKLQLSYEDSQKVVSRDFFCIDWTGIRGLQLIFSIFNRYGILNALRTTNEDFFGFLCDIRSRYNDVPYHNWIHACDVTEYVGYQATLARLDKIFSPMELSALFIAAVCHDTNHRGLNNIYNVKAETPIGILYKDQSVMETHHCAQTIEVVSKEDIFKNVEKNERKKLWNMIIKLILATDMAIHGKLVKAASDKIESGNFRMDIDENRLLALQLILKIADISNVSRPFSIADKWCDILSNEFFRQGDMEIAEGIGLTSAQNDRKNTNKPKSQVGFYNFVCVPLYQITARIFPELEVNLNSVKSNLETWKSMLPPDGKS